jgi:hypothetical protein
MREWVFRFVYLALCATLRLFALRRDGLKREAELLVLSHKVAILGRGPARPQPRWSDRAFVSAFARLLAPERRADLLVRRQRGFAGIEISPGIAGGIRTAVPAGHQLGSVTRELVLRLARENPRWTNSPRAQSSSYQAASDGSCTAPD